MVLCMEHIFAQLWQWTVDCMTILAVLLVLVMLSGAFLFMSV